MSVALELSRQLLSKPSVTPDDAGCQKLIENFLTPLGFKCEALRFGDVDNLWAVYGDHGPLVVFAGHTDVVPTGPIADWTSPPFSPVEREGFLFGRGAADMKCAIAAMLAATQEFLKRQPKINGRLAFLLTSDEESIAINGTKKVLEVLAKRKEKIQYCILGEPSSMAVVGDQIRVGRRGSLHGSLNVHGKQGHVAHPHLAENPIHKSLLALHELTQEIWDNGNQHFPATTLQMTNMQSGTGAKNVIPGHLQLFFNFRFSTALTPVDIQERTISILDKHALKYTLEWDIGGEPFLTKKGKLITATLEAIKEVAGLDAICSTGGGTSDGRFIAPTGAEVVELGLSHATAHQVNECARIQDIEQLMQIYLKLLAKLF